MTEKACGFAAVIGPPNAGKSTLSNALVGQKVSIVTQKAQTTRMRLRAIVMHDAAQIILVDTPGIFVPRQRLCLVFDRAKCLFWTGLSCLATSAVLTPLLKLRWVLWRESVASLLLAQSLRQRVNYELGGLQGAESRVEQMAVLSEQRIVLN